jgi:hypothetical protein
MRRVQLRDVAVETRSLLPRRIIPATAGGPGQRFFVLFRADDFLRATARVPVIPRCCVQRPRASGRFHSVCLR